jgi:ADP-ribose pyrophosphatase YjhB (NUDIX family)
MDDALIANQIRSLKNYLPGQSVDCVIIGYDNHELQILVLKWKNFNIWSLPGGFIYKDEDLNTAATRVLRDRTGLRFPYLDQFYTFGNKARKKLQVDWKLITKHGVDMEPMKEWLDQRFITTGYFALVDINECKPQPDFLSDLCEWRPLKKLPELMLDHKHIIKKALNHIKIQINYLPIGLSLLPELFTMKELQKLYAALLDKELDRGNFQRKMLKLGIFIRQEKQRIGAANKAPYLYKYDKLKYKEVLENGIGMVSLKNV